MLRMRSGSHTRDDQRGGYRLCMTCSLHHDSGAHKCAQLPQALCAAALCAAPAKTFSVQSIHRCTSGSAPDPVPALLAGADGRPLDQRSRAGSAAQSSRPPQGSARRSACARRRRPGSHTSPGSLRSHLQPPSHCLLASYSRDLIDEFTFARADC